MKKSLQIASKRQRLISSTHQFPKKQKTGSKQLNLAKITAYQRQFIAAREWDKYHTPKNLTIGLSVEVSELLELMIWMTDKQVRSLLSSASGRGRIEEEIADIFYYLVRLTDVLDINLESAFWRKTRLNEKKYPVNLSRGNAKKWSELAKK